MNPFCPAGVALLISLLLCFRARADTAIYAWGLDNTGQTNVPAGLTNASTIAAGGYHTLALKSDGTVVAWGAGTNTSGGYNYGQAIVPANATNVVAISAGSVHSVALKADGTVVVWGTLSGWSGPKSPLGLSNIVAVASGAQHDLYLRSEGTVIGWGNNGDHQTNTPSWLSNVVAVAGGGAHSLALRQDGTVVAWGNNAYGQTNVPVWLTNVVAISAGTNHSLALRADGTVAAWGDNSLGQTNVPAGLSNVIAIVAGYYHNLAIHSDGTVFGWGDDSAGETTPPSTVSGAFGIAAGYKHSVALLGGAPPFANGRLADQTAVIGQTVRLGVPVTGSPPISYQWSFNGTNLPGATNAALVLTNVQAGQSGVYTLTASNAFGVVSNSAMLTVNQIAVWGSNTYGQINLPPGLTNVVEIAAGAYHSVALRADGTVVAWGYNSTGQTNVPAGLSNVVAIAAGAFHNLALKSDGTVLAWGDQSTVPAGLTNVVAIAAAGGQNMALTADGATVAWGYQLPGLTNIVGVGVGSFQFAALRGDGTFLIWGVHNPPAPPLTNVPPDLTNVVALAGAQSLSTGHMLALRADGTVTSIGYGGPAVPPTLTNVVSVAGSEELDLAALSDGTLALWALPSDSATNPPPGLGGVIGVAAGFAHALALVGQGPPFLTTPLVDRTVAYGTPAWLYAGATGTWPLSYQWQFNGQDIQGATNAVLALGPVAFDQAGLYSVTVSNASGEVTSPELRLNVAPLLVTAQPQAETNVLGSTITLSVETSGQGISYQWELNGMPLAGATDSTFTLTNIQLVQAGNYSVIVTNQYGTVSSIAVPVAVDQVAVWGDNSQGQATPQGTLTNIIAVGAGGYHELALRADGTVAAWGYNPYGAATVPPGFTNVIAVAGGALHSVALLSDGTVVAWGDNLGGQATAPPGLSNVVAVASSGAADFTLALRSDGTVVGWGDNSVGQLNVPADLTNAVALAVGRDFSLALRADGTLSFWGDSAYNHSPPTGLSNIVAIAASSDHTLALQANGTVLSWGLYYNGSDGFGTLTPPPSLTNVAAIAAGYDHDMALQSDGTVLAWGRAVAGQANVPSYLHNVSAIAANDYDGVALEQTAPPVFRNSLGNPRLDASGFSVSYPTLSGHVYALEYKNSLTDPWTALPLVAGNGQTRIFSDPTVTGRQRRFYRIREW